MTIDEFQKLVESEINLHTDDDVKYQLKNDCFESFYRSNFSGRFGRDGIAYTPPEAIDFMIESMIDILRDDLGKNIIDDDITINDPFTGTGGFITRLISSPHIDPETLELKMSKGQIKSQEFSILSYYLAFVNISIAYKQKVGVYPPRGNVRLCDSFDQNPPL